MGIPGLSSLLKDQQQLFKPIKLNNTFLVIDGNNISILLHRRCEASVFNGDYRKYEQEVENFFRRLKQCKIFPVVILDGAHEARKFKKNSQSMEATINKNKEIKTVNYCTHGRKWGSTAVETPWPALVNKVFKNALQNEEIFYCQCLLEADSDITKAAQFLSCPVLSYDTDFYLNDVRFIPLSKLDFQPQQEGEQFFLPAQEFNRPKFYEIFGTLPNASFLPLLSFLLGNDYTKTEVHLYRAFFQTLHKRWYDQSRTKLNRKICILIEWLRGFDVPDKAVDAFLKEIPEESRSKAKVEVVRCLTESNSGVWSYLIHYMQHTLSSTPQVTSSLDLKAIEGSSKWPTAAGEYMAHNIPSEKLDKFPIPKWILKCHIEGKFPREIMDLLFSQTYFFPLQIEDHSKPSVSKRMLEIFRSILGIIFNSCPEKEHLPISIYLRRGDLCAKEYVTPISASNSFTLAKIPSLNACNRKNIALDILKLEKIEENLVPDSWKLFFFTIADWYRADTSQVMTAAVGSLIFSSIFVGIVDKQLPYNDNSFKEKLLKDYNDVIKRRGGNVKSPSVSTANFNIDSVDADDCIVAQKEFMELRNPNMSRPHSEQLDKLILHCLAQFQVNIMINDLLNSILHFPFSSLKIADFICGTLAYNIYFKIKEHNDLKSFVEVEFSKTPTLQALFLNALKIIEKLSKCPILSRKIRLGKMDNYALRRKRTLKDQLDWMFPEGIPPEVTHELKKPRI